jgi:hypothetical protein
MRTQHSERGFALAGAVFALVIIASLVAGAFFAARQELNIGRSSATYERAFSAAEAGMANAIAQWNTGSLNGLANGASTTLPTGTLTSGGTYTSTVTRLNDNLFMIRTTGTDPTGSSQRQLASLARLQIIQMNFNAGLTTKGGLQIGGSSFINGVDDSPSGWGCPSVNDTVAGIYTRDSTQVTTTGCSHLSCIAGSPKIQQDPTINDSTFFKYGDLDWNELTAMATTVYTGNTGPLTQINPSASGGVCDTGNLQNWGEPDRTSGYVTECINYFPIIYVNGNLQIDASGRGQGILLVEGDITVQGGFSFYGPVIARGQLYTTGTGGHFNGGVMAANVDLQQSTVLGNAIISYSSCAITRALMGNSSGRPLATRAWADLIQ